MALREVEIAFRSKSFRLSSLENCFKNKQGLYDGLTKLISESKSMQSDLDSAYRKLKKNKDSKADFYDWSNRQKSVWNGFSGRGGRRIRGDLNPMSIFNKYSRGDLDRYKANIKSARATIGRIKSERASISSKIASVKSDISEAKRLCAYVKTPEGKKEKKDLRQTIASLTDQISQLQSVLDAQKAKVEEQNMSIKLTKTQWRDEARKIKLSQ